jgi:hypothetical protein
MKDRRIERETSLIQGLEPGYKERVKENKYGGSTRYSCMKMEQDLLKLFLERRKEGERRKMKGSNLRDTLNTFENVTITPSTTIIC